MPPASFGEAPALQKLRIVAVIAILSACGDFAVWLVLAEFSPMLVASAASSPMVEVRPGYVIGVPLAIMAFCLAAVELLPRADPPRTRSGFIRTTRSQNAAFVVAIACMPLTPLAKPVGSIVVSDVMTARHYRACPHPDSFRGPTRRARTVVPCPDAEGG